MALRGVALNCELDGEAAPRHSAVELLPVISQYLPRTTGAESSRAQRSPWRRAEPLQISSADYSKKGSQQSTGGRTFLGLHPLQWGVILLHVMMVVELLYWDTYLQAMLKGALNVRLFSWHDTLYVVSAFGACFLSMALHSNLYGSDPGWVESGASLEDSRRPVCDQCGVRPPLRSRHCFTSGRCVAAFDHYCELLGTPIGMNNHLRFWVYLFVQSFVALWGMVLAWSAVGGCLAPSVIRDLKSVCWSEQPLRSIMLLTTAMSLTSLLSLFGMLWLLHTYFVSTAQTTYEILKGDGVPYLLPYYARYVGPHARHLPYSSIWPEIFRRVYRGNPPPTPFSEGFVRNWDRFLFGTQRCHKAAHG